MRQAGVSEQLRWQSVLVGDQTQLRRLCQIGSASLSSRRTLRATGAPGGRARRSGHPACSPHPAPALQAICPESAGRLPIRPLGLLLQTSSWNLPSLHFCPRASLWHSILRGGRQLAWRVSQLWDQTHCLVLIFIYYFFAKTFVVKEAVHEQAHSCLVKDQVHPDEPLWTAPPSSPRARARAVGSLAPAAPRSCSCRPSQPCCFSGPAFPQASWPSYSLSSALYSGVDSGTFSSYSGNVSSLPSSRQPPLTELEWDSSSDTLAYGCTCRSVPRRWWAYSPCVLYAVFHVPVYNIQKCFANLQDGILLYVTFCSSLFSRYTWPFEPGPCCSVQAFIHLTCLLVLWKHLYNQSPTRALRENGIVEKQGLTSGLCLHPLGLLTEKKIFLFLCLWKLSTKKGIHFPDLLIEQSEGFIFRFERNQRRLLRYAHFPSFPSPLQRFTLLLRHQLEHFSAWADFVHVNYFWKIKAFSFFWGF